MEMAPSPPASANASRYEVKSGPVASKGMSAPMRMLRQMMTMKVALKPILPRLCSWEVEEVRRR